MRKKASKRPVMVRIRTARYGVAIPLVSPNASLFDLPENGADDEDDDDLDLLPEEEETDEDVSALHDLLVKIGFDPADLQKADSSEPERSEFLSEGRLVQSDDRVEILYEESIITGMEGSVTSVGFSLAEPSVISMLRQGPVNTALIFEPHRRHISLYQTPYSAMEVCIHTLAVRNQLLSSGSLYLDYLMDIHGMSTERCKMWLTVE